MTGEGLFIVQNWSAPLDISPDIVAVAFSKLRAKRMNLPQGVALGVQAQEVDQLIDEISARLNLDLSRFKFRVTDYRAVNPAMVQQVGDTHRVSVEIYTERIDAILNYLQSLMPEERISSIGFTTPSES